MFRRTRLSVKPNVKTSVGGRGVTAGTQPLHSIGTQQSSPAVDNEGHEQPTAASTSAQISTEREHSSPERKEATAGIGDASESSKPSSALLQRRKRISTAPNLAKPRASVPLAQEPSTSNLKLLPAQDSVVVPPSTKLSIAKDVSEPPKNTLPVSPKIRVAHKLSVGQQSSLPEKRTPVPQVPQFSPFKKSSSKDANRNLPKDDGLLQKGGSPLVKERPTQEDPRLEETAENFKSAPKKTQESDRERILKAQKLRELLRQELKKEKKEKYPIIEGTIPPDRSRMTMRDFIYYLPDANPMKSAFEKEKKSEKSPSIQIQTKEPEQKSANKFEPEDELEEDENDEGPLLVPRVKVAEDGTIILDEESLTVEVLRAKGPIVEENDPIFERGSTTTYSSFKKSTYSKPWSNKETDMFFLAISMVGTDFSMIGQLFPHRERIEIKNKFKREERSNGWRIDKAFKEKKPFDFEFFAKLLNKIIAEEAERKQKSVKNKTTPEKKKHKPGSKKGKSAGSNAAKSSKHSEYTNNSDTEATDINARIAEKENEESPNVPKGQNVSGSSKKKKKKKKMNDSEKVLVNPSEDDIPPDLSVAQVKMKKKKRQSLEEAAADTGDPIICLEQSELECSGKHQEVDMLVDERPECASSESEKAGQDDESPSSAENTTNMENEKPVAIKPAPHTRGKVQKPKPNLGKAVLKKVEVEMENAKGKQTEPEIQHTDGEDTVLAAASGQSQPDLGVVISEKLPEQDFQTVVKNSPGNQSKTAVEHHRSEEENKPKSVLPSTRGHFQKPKPNLQPSPGRKEIAIVAKVAKNEAATTEEVVNEEMGHDDPWGSPSSSADHSRKGILDEEESMSLRKSPRYYNSTKLELMQQPEGGASSASLGRTLHCTRSPSGIVQSEDSTGTCTTNTKEESKQQSLKLPTRGRFQRPTPNLRQAPGKKETATVAKVPEEEDASTTKEVMKDEMSYEGPMDISSSSADLTIQGILDKESFSARKSPRYHNSAKLELLQQSEDGACLASLYSQPSSALCPHDVVQNIASTDTCRTNIEEESEPQSVKLPTRGRFQRPKPNLCPAPGRKETATVAKVPEKEDASATEEVVNEEGKFDKEESFSSRKSPRCHNSTKLELLQQPEDGACSASLGSSLACVVQPSAFSPGSLVQTEASIDNCRSDPCPMTSPEQHKSESPKPAQFRRGRFQKPRPNLSMTVGRRSTAVAENVTADCRKSDGEKTENSLKEHDGHDCTSQPALAISPNRSEHLSYSKHSVNDNFDESKLDNLTPSTISPEQLYEPDQSECNDLADNRVITKTLEEAQPQYTSCTSTIHSPRERKQESLVPAPLVRGRFLRPRPNVGKSTIRKDTCASPSIHSNKVEISLVSPQRISSVTPNLVSKSEAKEVTAFSLCSSSQATQNSPLVKSNVPENLLECSSQGEKEYLLPSNDHESNSSDKTGLDTKNMPQMCSNENAIKPTPLLRGRFQRPKPNLAVATERKEFPAEGKNVISNKEDTDVDSAVKCHAVLDQLTHKQHNSDPNKAEPASVDLFKRKALVDQPEALPAVSPKRGRRGNIQTAKEPTLCKSGKEQLKRSPSPTTCAAVTVKTTRQAQKCKLLDPEEQTPQRKASEPPCEPEHSKPRKTILKRKPTTVKGSKNIKGRSAGKKHVVSKRTLVTLRASSQEEDDDDDDVDADTDYGEESDDLAPEEMNKAPVFVPKGLRSPNPVAVTIEETMEEFDMSCDTCGSQYVTDVSNLPSYLCEVKEVNNGFTNENSRMQLNISTPQIATVEEKEIFDGNTEAALALLAIGDPVFQAKKNMQRAIDEPDEQREISIDLQKHVPVQPTVTEGSPSHVPVVPVTKHPSTVQSDDRLDLKTDIPSCKETLSSELKISVPSKSSRSRFPKPKPNLIRAVGIKRRGQQNPLIQPMEQASEDHSKGPPIEGTLTEQSIAHKNDQSKLVTNISAGLDELKEDIIEQQEQKTQSCERRGDLFKSILSCETIEEGMITPEYSSCQSSEGGHFLQDTGPFEVSSYTHWEQEEHLEQHQNVKITCTNQNEAVNIDSEEQTFILTLVEIPNVSIDGYDAENGFSNSEDSLPAPQFVSPTNTEIQCGTQAQSNENLKAAADMHVDAPCDQLRPSHLLQEFQKPRKRNACVAEQNVICAKKMTPNTIQDVSCKNMFGNTVEEMPLEPSITPDIVEKRTVTTWKSKTFEPLEVKPSSSKSSVTRPARKPLGFLPLIFKKPNSENDIVIKNNPSRVAPSFMTTPKPGLKRLPSLKNPLEAQAPCTSAASSLDYSRWSGSTTYPPAAAQFEVTAMTQEQRNVSSPKTTEPEKEPTGISEYFFGDIFTEVNDCD